jgi:hypothetical protein
MLDGKTVNVYRRSVLNFHGERLGVHRLRDEMISVLSDRLGRSGFSRLALKSTERFFISMS